MKKMMKAVAALMLAVVFVCVAGCGSDNSNGANDKNENKAIDTTKTGGTNDKDENKTIDATKMEDQKNLGNHEYVDLGLPSGTLWATCNVGANSPEDFGEYFAWGDCQPKEIYNWFTYQYCNGSEFQLTKYCDDASFGYNAHVDKLTTLVPEEDAATANWGSEWCIPSKEQWEELVAYTTRTKTILNDVKGIQFTASNGNSVFMPAAGHRWYNELKSVGEEWNYMSNSIYKESPQYYYQYDLRKTTLEEMFGFVRCGGSSVRPVRAK